MDSLNPESFAPVMAVPVERLPRVWKFWGTALWGTFIFAAMFVGQIVPVVLIVLWKVGSLDLGAAAHMVSDGKILSLSVLFGLPAVVAAVWLPVRLSRTPLVDYLALRLPSWQNLVIGIVAMGAVVMGWDAVS